MYASAWRAGFVRWSHVENLFKIYIPLAISLTLFFNQAVFADTDISISVSPEELNLNLMPGEYGYIDQTITVSTTNIAGYTVKLSTSGVSTSLVNTEDSSKTIPTFTLPEGASEIPLASLDYGYGFSLDGGANYRPVPDPSAPPSKIFETSTAGGNTHTLTFGAKVLTNTAAGTYTNTFTIVALANLEPCPHDSICYYGNSDDKTGTMDNQAASSNSEITLIAPNFSRPNYGFAGWNTEIDGAGTNYGPNQTITTGDLSIEGLQLYAKWVPSTGNLQNWEGCNSLSEGVVIALTDTRDNNTYAVTKYADNQCWMMENLRLDLSDPDLEISNLNTNKPTAAFANAVNNNHPASTNTFCTAENSACIDQILFNTNNTNRDLTASYSANNTSSSWYSYGNYYNWHTATAGNGTYSISTAGASASGDICPANWKLPTGYGDVGNFAVLDRAIGGSGKNQTADTPDGAVGSKRWRNYPLNFIYGGEQKGDSAANRAASCSYATPNVIDARRTANLWIRDDRLYVNSNNTSKVRGQTVRCIFNGGYHVKGDIHYDANGGIGTMADEIDVDFGTALAANNQFTKQNSTFSSWNTSPDGSGIVVSEGGMVADAAEHIGLTDGETLTLYAIWRLDYRLVYDGNGANAGSMSSANVFPLTTGSLSLVPSNFSRTGYGFAGWSLDADAGTKLLNGESVTVYGPNEKITVNNSFLSHADPINYQINLYAVWLPENSIYTMQSFGTTECSNIDIGDMLALKDTRDGQVYSVVKLADNKCWMAENLRLDPAATALDDNNTNLPTAPFATAATTSATADTLCNTDDSACVDTIRFNSNNINRGYTASYDENISNRSWYSYGIMYNWYTASAGNGDFTMDSGNVAGDICPKGWRLPTGGSSGEYVALNNAINNGSSSTDAGLLKFPANFIYSGDYNYNKPGGRGSYGRWWSATPNGNAKAFRLGVTASGATPDGSWNKWDAFAVRCIVK